MKPAGDMLFVGSSGLIGSLALPLLLEQATASGHKVFVPVRSPPQRTHPQMIPLVGSFDAAMDRLIESALQAQQASLKVFLCALGTTMAMAGSQAAFTAVDRDLVLHLAALALRHGASHAVVVSSVGADARSSNFYLRTKGRMERDISGLGFARCDFLHPGLLLGPRNRDRRVGERIAQKLSALYNPLLAGPLRRYRAIQAKQVAAALAHLSQINGEGIFRHEFDEIDRLALSGGESTRHP